MKDKITPIIITMLIMTTAFSLVGASENIQKISVINPPNIMWKKVFSSDGNDCGNSVVQTSDGGYIIAGAYNHQTCFPWLGYCYVLKVDASGNTEWEYTYGGTNAYEGFSIRETSDGGFIVAGHTGYSDPMDVYLLKLDVQGNEEWQNTYGGSQFDGAYSITETVDGGFILVGNTVSFGAGNRDVYLIKTYSNGTLEWSQTYGGVDYDEGWEVKQTSDNGFIIVANTLSFGAGGRDVFLIKTDENGSTLWTQTYGGFYYDEGWSVDQTTDGGYIIGGDTMTYGTSSTYDAWLIKTDATGNEQWNKTFGGIDIDAVYSVQQTTDGGYILAGSTSSFSGSYLYNIYVIKTDENGNVEWDQVIGEGNCEIEALEISETSDQGYILTGYQWSYNTLNEDLFIVKLEGISKPPDTPTIVGPANGSPNSPLDFTITTTDPENDDIYYYVDWGDETTTEWIGPYASGQQITITKTYTNPGIYEIKVKAKDSNEAHVGWSTPHEITIHENLPPEPPTITGETQGKTGEKYNYAIVSQDPENDEVHYYVDWGDNITEGWFGPYPAGETITITHTWEEDGTYTVKVKAKDTSDAESDWATLDVTMPVNIYFNHLIIELIQQILHNHPFIIKLTTIISHLIQYYIN